MHGDRAATLLDQHLPVAAHQDTRLTTCHAPLTTVPPQVLRIGRGYGLRPDGDAADGDAAEKSLAIEVEVGTKGTRCESPDVALEKHSSAKNVSLVKRGDVIETFRTQVRLSTPLFVEVVVEFVVVTSAVGKSNPWLTSTFLPNSLSSPLIDFEISAISLASWFLPLICK